MDWGWVDAPSGAAAVDGGAATLLDQLVAGAPPSRLRAALERFGPAPLLVRSSASVLVGFGLARVGGQPVMGAAVPGLIGQ